MQSLVAEQRFRVRPRRWWPVGRAASARIRVSVGRPQPGWSIWRRWARYRCSRIPTRAEPYLDRDRRIDETAAMLYLHRTDDLIVAWWLLTYRRNSESGIGP
ncbi:hypothetical protein ACQP1O_27615 [Nocardia sp. CA-151230]|uniref:hypothetical protein n=1 Tax=Nocardia sp. CA-151230 TaxID=3239982 RepID=UPI003D8ADD9E